MKFRNNINRKKAEIIAAAVTFVVAMIILVALFFVYVGNDRAVMAEASMPEMQDDEEIYLEPELLVLDNPGDADAPDIDEAAPQTPGLPDPAPEEQPQRVVKNETPPKEKPVSNKPQQISGQRESDVKTSTPQLSKEDEKRIASTQGKFKTDNNGSASGEETASSGSGGNGISAKGNINGRTMKSCPTWKLKLTQKTVVSVRITVDADGNVTAASAVSGGTPNLRKECEKMALRSKWTPKPGASPASGNITFTISPN